VTQVSRVHRDHLEVLEHKVQLDPLDQLVMQVNKDSLVLRDRRVRVETKAILVSLDKQDHPDQPEPKEARDKLVQLDNLDHKVHQVHKELKEVLVYKVMLEFKEAKDQ
jgi:hypothetical protein